MVNRFQANAMVTMVVGGLLLAACSVPPPTISPDDRLATAVAATLSSVPTNTEPPPPPTQTMAPTIAPTATMTPQPTLTQTSSPTPLAFNLTGKICFPAETIPPMTVFFEETNTATLLEMPVLADQSDYEIKLNPGNYIAYAWLPDFSRGGLYSRAVPCGLGTDCDDHTVLPFTVTETEILEGIDVCDWFAGPFNVPYPPGQEPTEVTGIISGSLSYLEAEIPELRVVAFNVDTEYYYWVYSQPGQITYSINNLPPGTYNVVAYDSDSNAGGHATGNHELIDVVVEPGQATAGININDWKAPPGTFPPDPTP